MEGGGELLRRERLPALPPFRHLQGVSGGFESEGSQVTLGPLFEERPLPSRPNSYTASILDSHERNLSRNSERLAASILRFCTPGKAFHMDALREWVEKECGKVAPDSPGRVMRDLRQKGLLDVVLLSRRESLYRVKP